MALSVLRADVWSDITKPAKKRNSNSKTRRRVHRRLIHKPSPTAAADPACRISARDRRPGWLVVGSWLARGWLVVGSWLARGWLAGRLTGRLVDRLA